MAWSTTTWVMVFLAPIIVFTAGHLFLGIARKVTARIHRRIGPPVLQQFIDVMKLFGKRESTTHSWVQDMGALFAVIGVFASALFIPIGGDAVLSFQGDLIVLAYLLVIAPLGMALGTGSTGNPNSAIGVSRGLMLMMAYELPFAMVLVTVILHFKTASLAEIVESQDNFKWAVLFLPLSAIAADLSLQAMMGEKPFDQPVAPSEIGSGPMVEFGGKYLGMLMVWHAMSIVVEAGLFVDLFLGGGVVFPGDGTLALVGNIFVWLLLSLGMFMIAVFINTVFGRFKMGQALRFYWGFPTLIALIGLALVVLSNLGVINW
ncbi:MAG: NADH-quinone oxidoreductase subunit H [Candidatus Thermoplasmatota archaeon]|nr:NADH-quinone oxidoreductase subunit H [Candidatus Thermoplasmatota archaeon]